MSGYALSHKARRDLQEIWAHIADDNETAARSVAAGLREKFEFLGQSPRTGRTREDLSHGLRSFPFRDYLILYRVAKPGVRIIRVIHGRRDLPRLLN